MVACTVRVISLTLFSGSLRVRHGERFCRQCRLAAWTRHSQVPSPSVLQVSARCHARTSRRVSRRRQLPASHSRRTYTTTHRLIYRVHQLELMWLLVGYCPPILLCCRSVVFMDSVVDDSCSITTVEKLFLSVSASFRVSKSLLLCPL